MTNRKKTVFLILLIFLSYGINAQKQAQEFLNKQRNKETCDIIYLKTTDELIKTNINQLNDVVDTTVLKIFIEEFTNQLNFYGLDVKKVQQYPNTLKNNEHILEFSQIEMEEYPFYDSIVDEQNKKLKFYKQINGVNINIWLTYNAENDIEKLIFYNQEEITDDMDGYFEQTNDGQAFINYELTEINPNDVYLITYFNACNSATYFFNFLLNRYVYLNTDGEDKNYYGISSNRTLITKKQPFDNFDILE